MCKVRAASIVVGQLDCRRVEKFKTWGALAFVSYSNKVAFSVSVSQFFVVIVLYRERVYTSSGCTKTGYIFQIKILENNDVQCKIIL